MKIKDWMSKPAVSCGPGATLEEAARLMWEGDLGIVPVIGSGGELVGILTDRDACMGSYIRGRALNAVRVSETMSRDVCSCRASESIEQALFRMRERQVRRLPVVDEENRLIGVLSMNDIVRGIARLSAGTLRSDLAGLLVETMASICTPRQGELASCSLTPAAAVPRKSRAEVPARP